jgi:hypothetical protein
MLPGEFILSAGPGCCFVFFLAFLYTHTVCIIVATLSFVPGGLYMDRKIDFGCIMVIMSPVLSFAIGLGVLTFVSLMQLTFDLVSMAITAAIEKIKRVKIRPVDDGGADA